MEEQVVLNNILDNRYIILNEKFNNDSNLYFFVNDSLAEKIYVAKIFNCNKIPSENEIKINIIISQKRYPSFIKYITSSNGLLITDNIKEYKKYMISEYCTDLDLLKYISVNNMPFNERICKFFFYKILKPFEFLNNCGICLGNINLENILVDKETCNIKIDDLSHSYFFIKKNGEIIKNGAKDDILILANLLFSLRTGKKNYYTINKKLNKMIKKNQMEEFWKIIEMNLRIKDLSPEFKSLFNSMVISDPKIIPTIEDIYNSNFMKDLKNLNDEQLREYEAEAKNEIKKREKIDLLIYKNENTI